MRRNFLPVHLGTVALCLLFQSFGQASTEPELLGWDSNHYEFTTGDFNGDGYLDLILLPFSEERQKRNLESVGIIPTTSFKDSTIKIWFGQGTSSGQTARFVEENTQHFSSVVETINLVADDFRIIALDMDADGKDEIWVVPTSAGNPPAN